MPGMCARRKWSRHSRRYPGEPAEVLHGVELGRHLRRANRDPLAPSLATTTVVPARLVETMGIEPTTPCLQSRCSSQLSYVPRIGTPRVGRTHDSGVMLPSTASGSERRLECGVSGDGRDS